MAPATAPTAAATGPATAPAAIPLAAPATAAPIPVSMGGAPGASGIGSALRLPLGGKSSFLAGLTFGGMRGVLKGSIEACRPANLPGGLIPTLNPQMACQCFGKLTP